MRIAVTLVLSLLILGAVSWADAPVPAGDQFQVNTSTFSQQMLASVAADSAGNFVVVWTSQQSQGDDNSGRSIQGQRYDSSGAPVGGEFQINTYTTGTQDEPEVAMDSQGNFVVIWSSNGSGGTDTSSESIQGQRFDSDGNLVGGQFQVNTYTTDKQDEPSVGMDPLGNFVVVWGSYGSSGTDSDYESIQGQFFDSNGDPVGGEFQVNTITSQRQDSAAVTADGQGNFVVVWESEYTKIKGQLYDDSGAAVGGEFRVDSAGYGDRPDVAADSLGNFVVAWEAAEAGGVDTSERSIEAQRFDVNGNPVGGQFQVNTYTTDEQTEAIVAMAPQGDFVVVWKSEGSDTSYYRSIQAQYFDSGGNAVGDQFQVNTYTTYFHHAPFATMDGQGNFIVVWDSEGSPGNDSSNRAVQGQRYSAGAEVVFTDGFESGNTSGWSSTVD